MTPKFSSQIGGVTLTALTTHNDERGSLTKIFRENWVKEPPVQWNHVQSNAGALRGVHAHFQHTDYMVVLAGFYFPEPSVIVYSVTQYFHETDELGCRWDDPQLRIPWPFPSATISPRDELLPSLAVFQNQVQERLASIIPHPQLLPDDPSQRPDL